MGAQHFLPWSHGISRRAYYLVYMAPLMTCAVYVPLSTPCPGYHMRARVKRLLWADSAHQAFGVYISLCYSCCYAMCLHQYHSTNLYISSCHHSSVSGGGREGRRRVRRAQLKQTPAERYSGGVPTPFRARARHSTARHYSTDGGARATWRHCTARA